MIPRQDLGEIVAAPLEWERFSGKTILVTGAAGFLPAWLVETFLFLNEQHRADCRVLGLVRNLGRARARFPHFAGRDDFKLIEGDASAPPAFPGRCDYIIHAASPASPRDYLADPVGTMAVNLLGTDRLLRQARDWKSDGFLLFSSSEVYGEVGPGRTSIAETDYGFVEITKPRSCYAESKRAAETLCASYRAQFGVPAVIVRPFHTYGPGMRLDDGRVHADFVRDIVQRRDLILRSDGKAVRAFCHAADATRGFLTVLLRGLPGQAYNVGNPEAACSIEALATTLVGLYPELGLKLKRAAAASEGAPSSPITASVPNIERVRALGWEPRLSIEKGFRRTVEYYLGTELPQKAAEAAKT